MSKRGGGPEETEEEKELARIGFERWEDYKQRFIPVENLAIKDVMDDINSPTMEGEGMANVDTQSAFSELEEQTASGLARRGARTGSGAFAGSLTDVNLDRMASSSGGQSAAYGLQRRNNISNLQNLVNLGQGKASAGLAGLSTVADAASRQAIMDARASAASRAALGQVAGAAAGIGFGIYNSNSYIPTASPEALGEFGLSNPDVEWQQLPGTY